MTAGKPNYQKLHDMNRLPEKMRHMIPGLAQTDKLQKELEAINSILCKNCKEKVLALSAPKEEVKKETPKTTEPVHTHIPNERVEEERKAAEEEDEKAEEKAANEVRVRCPAFKCEYVAVGKSEGISRNNLRLHQKGKHKEMFEAAQKVKKEEENK